MNKKKNYLLVSKTVHFFTQQAQKARIRVEKAKQFLTKPITLVVICGVLVATLIARFYVPTSNTPIAAYNLGNPQNLVAWMEEKNITTLSNNAGCDGVSAGTAQLMYTENNTPVFVHLIGYAQWHVPHAGCDIKIVKGRQQGDFWHTVTTNGVELSIFPFSDPATNPTYPGQTRNDAIPLSELRAAMDANGWTYLYLDPPCSNDTHNARMYIHLDDTILVMETNTGSPDYVFVQMEGGIGQHYDRWDDGKTLCHEKQPVYISTYQGAEWPWRNAYNLWFLPFDPALPQVNF